MSMRPKRYSGGSGGGEEMFDHPPSGFVTESGFGVCHNGAIGFADDVTLGTSGAVSGSITTLGSVDTSLNSSGLSTTNSAAKTPTGKRAIISSNRDAQDAMALMSCGGVGSSKLKAAGGYPCTCESHVAAGAATRTEKKSTPFENKLRDIVFEAQAGIPYSPEAAGVHQAVDIFNTYPNGVPLHDEMDPELVGHATKLNAALETARAVTTSVALGVKDMHDAVGPIQKAAELAGLFDNLIHLGPKYRNGYATRDRRGDPPKKVQGRPNQPPQQRGGDVKNHQVRYVRDLRGASPSSVPRGQKTTHKGQWHAHKGDYIFHEDGTVWKHNPKSGHFTDLLDKVAGNIMRPTDPKHGVVYSHDGKTGYTKHHDQKKFHNSELVPRKKKGQAPRQAPGGGKGGGALPHGSGQWHNFVRVPGAPTGRW